MMATNDWRTWLLGIAATLIAAMVGNDIVFQSETRAALATLTERISHGESRANDILKYLKERLSEREQQRDEAIQRLEKRIDQLEQRR